MRSIRIDHKKKRCWFHKDILIIIFNKYRMTVKLVPALFPRGKEDEASR